MNRIIPDSKSSLSSKQRQPRQKSMIQQYNSADVFIGNELNYGVGIHTHRSQLSIREAKYVDYNNEEEEEEAC